MMSSEYLSTLDERYRQAVAELIALIAEHYPTATFTIHPGEDDPAGTYITTTIDIDDPDEVLDLVLRRELEWQLEQGLAIYVIPIRTPERTAALLQEQRGALLPPRLPVPSPPHGALARS